MTTLRLRKPDKTTQQQSRQLKAIVRDAESRRAEFVSAQSARAGFIDWRSRIGRGRTCLDNSTRVRYNW